MIEGVRANSPPNNLVPPVTSFVGREADIEQIGRLMNDARLVTLTGPPGAGKTRLAEVVARRTLDRFEGGTWFVELASLADPELVLSTIAEAVGVLSTSTSSLYEALSARFGERPALVVLDNFEHLMPAATAVAGLMSSAQALRLLVTSRTLLRLSGEQEYVVPPLPVPPPDVSAQDLARIESVELFRRRAVASEPGFAVIEGNAEDLGELCRRLDGLPLALELAAARVRLMPLAAILARVDRRLGLLSDGPRDLPERHRSLRAAVAWSYDLLAPAEQQLFRRLSVFRGGWTIEGASAVDGAEASESEAVIASLSALVDSSLIVRDPSEDSEPRFTMLETLREFAGERLADAGETEGTRARHADHCLAIATREAPRFTGSDSRRALDLIAREHDNLRTAIGQYLDHDPARALRLASALWRFWQMRGHLLEGDRWLSAALVAGSDLPEVDRADALAAKGSLAYWRGDMAGARPSYEAALALRRTIGDDAQIADALYDLAFVFAPSFYPSPADPVRTEQGARLLREASDLFRAAGDEAGLAKTGWLHGNFTLYQDLGEGESLLRETVEQYRRLNDPFALGWALRTHGCALLGTRDTAGASRAFREALTLLSAADDGSALGLLLGDLGNVALIEGDGVRAARLMGASAQLRQVTEAGLASVDVVPWLSHARPIDEVLGPGELKRSLAEGRAMTQREAIAYALESTLPSQLDEGLRISSLGPFVVERSGRPVSRWGGPKAGSRQAQAMFAFLFDRGERGVTKDEFIEVIWPDAEVAQGDLNFHRTLGGLRTTLQAATPTPAPVTFSNGRYRLSREVVDWDDITEFERHLEHAAQATDELAAIRGLEEARALYRGDFLDDCPIYGDSEYVEARRTSLRGRLTDALVDLGHRYERRGDATLAAARFREALDRAGGECSAATLGLERLGVATA